MLSTSTLVRYLAVFVVMCASLLLLETWYSREELYKEWNAVSQQIGTQPKPEAVNKWIINNSTDVAANHLVQEFQREWLRQRRAQVDWESLARPCVGHIAWGEVKEGWGKQNRTNATVSVISYWDIRPAGEYSKFFIQSRTADGKVKNIGGDSWRVYVRGTSSLAATVFDHNNGSYEALFLLLEPGIYRVLIYLDYSLCDGVRDPPIDWFITGL